MGCVDVIACTVLPYEASTAHTRSTSEMYSEKIWHGGLADFDETVIFNSASSHTLYMKHYITYRPPLTKHPKLSIHYIKATPSIFYCYRMCNCAIRLLWQPASLAIVNNYSKSNVECVSWQIRWTTNSWSKFYPSNSRPIYVVHNINFSVKYIHLCYTTVKIIS